MFGWVVSNQARKDDLKDLKRPSVNGWERLDKVYPTLVECEEGLALQADTFEFYLKQRDPDAKRHGKVFLSHDASYLYGHEFSCLPDTVDPRGPKGEGRR